MNSLGRIFRVAIFGESHGSCVGVLVDGCPPGIPLSVADLMKNLERRRSGARGTTQRTEQDLPVIESGVFKGHTTGAPILIRIANEDKVTKDYLALESIPRPGHADFAAGAKFMG